MKAFPSLKKECFCYPSLYTTTPGTEGMGEGMMLHRVKQTKINQNSPDGGEILSLSKRNETNQGRKNVKPQLPKLNFVVMREHS